MPKKQPSAQPVYYSGFGRRLDAARHHMSMTKAILAGKLGVSLKTLQRYLADSSPIPPERMEVAKSVFPQLFGEPSPSKLSAPLLSTFKKSEHRVTIENAPRSMQGLVELSPTVIRELFVELGGGQTPEELAEFSKMKTTDRASAVFERLKYYDRFRGKKFSLSTIRSFMYLSNQPASSHMKQLLRGAKETGLSIGDLLDFFEST